MDMNQSNNFQASSPPSPMQVDEGSMESHLLELQNENIKLFWHQQQLEINQLSGASYKHHPLPLARIRRVMKSNEDVQMISADAPALLSKASELLVKELTLRSWLHAEENNRRTIQKHDIAQAVSRGEALHFLVDLVPRDEIQDEEESGSDGGQDEPNPSNGVYVPAMDSN